MNEKIYQDFTEKFLPTIKEGLTISKDYFMDLFGRYVQYLIIIDSIRFAISLIVVLFLAYLIWKNHKSIIEDGGYTPVIFLSILMIFPSIYCLLSGAIIIKDIYIPEVRIYEITQSMR